MIAPPKLGPDTFASVIVAWNGSFQAARSVEYALPFLAKASEITVIHYNDPSHQPVPVSESDS